MNKIKLGISACLLGERVRYDRGHKLDDYLRNTLGEFIEWVGLCPEVECGFPVSREPVCLVGSSKFPRLVTKTGRIDHTQKILKWTKQKLKHLKKQNLCGFVFKSKSPSCSVGGVGVYTRGGILKGKSKGIFARQFENHFPLLSVIEDIQMHNRSLRENFLQRVFVYKRWHDFVHNNGTIKGLICFHARHRLLIMSYSPRILKALEEMINNQKEIKRKAILDEYGYRLTNCFKLKRTIKKNVNVLDHILRDFKNDLNKGQRHQIEQAIDNYRKDLTPLIPIVLLRNYVREYKKTKLKGQYYLYPVREKFSIGQEDIVL